MLGGGRGVVYPPPARVGIAAVLVYAADGTYLGAWEEVAIIMGPRPICQATKLLDPDPIVRKMAEQALLDMGKPAKGYLDEQRAKASTELQEAIDRIWKRILERERW